MSMDNDPGQTFQSLFPSSTSIKDFAYPDSHPLRKGNFTIAHVYDSIENYSSDDDNEFYDENNDNDDVNEFAQGDYSSDEINRKAIALFDFKPENDNEVALTEGQIIWISYRHGQGWLVAEDPETGENGLVPEEYVEIYYNNNEIIEDIPKPFLPEILQGYNHKQFADDDESDSEWVDTDYDDNGAEELTEEPIKERNETVQRIDSDVETLESQVNNVSLKE